MRDKVTFKLGNSEMKNRLLIAIVSVIVVVFFILYLFNSTSSRPVIVDKNINNAIIHVEYARSPNQQQLGLSHRDSMADNHAMLFIFQREQPQFFWMKDMKFPIDIIWLDRSCRIVDISPQQQPCDPNKICQLISPQRPAQFALETVSGLTEKLQLRVNQQLDICR